MSMTAVHPGTSTASGAVARNRYVRATLAIAGGVAVAIGAAITLVTRSFIDIDGDPSADLLSETRAPAGAILAIGVFMLVAAVRQRHLATAAWMATLLYLGYGLARAAGLIIDGWPSATIVAATIVELAIGIASLAAVIASSHDVHDVQTNEANRSQAA
jgi:peptidoglycan/LPS O-acetylase OafA/YrhL